MAKKPLRSIAPKDAKFDLKGVKKSSIEAGSLGDDPGVDYDPKAKADRDFVALHKTEKHADRVGNGEDVYAGSKVKYSLDTKQNARRGNTQKEAEKVYEAKEKEDAKCNMTAEGAHCPVHGKGDCSKMTKLNEKGESEVPFPGPYDKDQKSKDKNAAKNAAKKALKNVMKGNVKEESIAKFKTNDTKEEIDMVRTELKAIADKTKHMLSSMPKNVHVEPWVQAKIAQAKEMIGSVHDYVVYGNHVSEEIKQVDEVITKKTSTGEVIHDFVHSDNPKFKGKSKEERIKMALGAKYAMMRKEDLAMPMLEGGKKKKKVEKEQADTPITYGDGAAQGRV